MLAEGRQPFQPSAGAVQWGERGGRQPYWQSHRLPGRQRLHDRAAAALAATYRHGSGGGVGVAPQ